VSDRCDAAVRAQFLDDVMGTSICSIVLDRYVGSRSGKWTAEHDRSRSTDSSLELGVIGIGPRVGM